MKFIPMMLYIAVVVWYVLFLKLLFDKFIDKFKKK